MTICLIYYKIYLIIERLRNKNVSLHSLISVKEKGRPMGRSKDEFLKRVQRDKQAWEIQDLQIRREYAERIVSEAENQLDEHLDEIALFFSPDKPISAIVFLLKWANSLGLPNEAFQEALEILKQRYTGFNLTSLKVESNRNWHLQISLKTDN